MHTGNSGAKVSIYRDERRTDRASLNVSISAMGLISSNIEVVGQDFDGFTADQLRDFANMFLYAANELGKKSDEQEFVWERGTTSILENDETKTEFPSVEKSKKKLKIDRIPKDIFRNIFPVNFGSNSKFEKLMDERPKTTLKDLLYESLKKMTVELV